jgi:hypothetical protein
LLIDFFLTVGLPKHTANRIREDVEKSFNGDYSSEQVFKRVQEIILKEKDIE